MCQNTGKKHTYAHDKVTQTQLALANLLGERQLREYRADQAHLMKEMAYLRKIADLETERKQLQDNQPCPLCGALQHPFAEGNVPEPDETERRIVELTVLIEQADKLEADQKVLEAEEKKLSAEMVATDKQLQQAQSNKDASQLAITNKLADYNLGSENHANLQNEIMGNLKPFGLTEIKDTDPGTLSSLLDQRLYKWQDHQQQKTTIEGQINGLSARVENINGSIRSFSDSMKSKITEIRNYRNEVEVLNEERNGLYGLKNPDTEELRFTTKIAASEQSERVASDQKNSLSQELVGLKERIKELEASTFNRKRELGNDEVTFLASLQASGFDDEATFAACRLSRERREELQRQANALDLKHADIEVRKKDREDRLVNEVAKKITETPIDNLIEQQQTASISLISIREDIWTKKQKLLDNANTRIRFGQISLRIQAQKSECRRWDSLYNLIGSADGKKYRNFAQGLTFEIMVAHANLQLMKLTDRYLLIRDKEQPLDLNVVDNYQAGEVRSTKNLSGGESFIVSLALALGLSKMASKNVRVDSLFLDEGFGTLDEDTLETALETLASLRQDGKLIGVISHVSALKERISTKILVQKVSGGKSIISGPGCSKVN